MFAALRRSGGIESLVRRTELPPATVSAVAEAMLPELLACLRAFVERAGGEETGVKNLLAVLEELGGGRLAAEVMGHEPFNPEPGETVLKRICDGNAIKRPVPGAVAERTGVDLTAIDKILPLLTMLLCGYIAARAKGSGAEDGFHWALDVLVTDKKI